MTGGKGEKKANQRGGGEGAEGEGGEEREASKLYLAALRVLQKKSGAGDGLV